MNDTSSDDILLLKQRLAEQEALNRALLDKLADREREIDCLQAQLDKLRRMNFSSRSEKVSRRISQMEADLNRLQAESDTLTGRVDDPEVQRPLRQTRTRNPFPESLPRDEKRLLPAEPCCPDCGGAWVKMPPNNWSCCAAPSGLSDRTGEACLHKMRCHRAGPRAFTPHRARYRRTGLAGPRADLKVCRAHPTVPSV